MCLMMDDSTLGRSSMDKLHDMCHCPNHALRKTSAVKSICVQQSCNYKSSQFQKKCFHIAIILAFNNHFHENHRTNCQTTQ